jgi:hypothetical protein
LGWVALYQSPSLFFGITSFWRYQRGSRYPTLLTRSLFGGGILRQVPSARFATEIVCSRAVLMVGQNDWVSSAPKVARNTLRPKLELVQEVGSQVAVSANLLAVDTEVVERSTTSVLFVTSTASIVTRAVRCMANPFRATGITILSRRIGSNMG